MSVSNEKDAVTMTDSKVGKIQLVDVVEHENGDATYSFDLDEESVKLAQDLGLKLMLYCGFSGVSTDEAFQLILDRADYLNQEPDLLNRFDECGATRGVKDARMRISEVPERDISQGYAGQEDDNPNAGKETL